MSELTPCNYCNLNRIKSRAKLEGKSVILSSRNADFGMGGTECFIVPKGMEKSQLDNASKEERDEYFTAWFMELTNHCVC